MPKLRATEIVDSIYHINHYSLQGLKVDFLNTDGSSVAEMVTPTTANRRHAGSSPVGVTNNQLKIK